jgi:hypothetical protein
MAGVVVSLPLPASVLPDAGALFVVAVALTAPAEAGFALVPGAEIETVPVAVVGWGCLAPCARNGMIA